MASGKQFLQDYEDDEQTQIISTPKKKTKQIKRNHDKTDNNKTKKKNTTYRKNQIELSSNDQKQEKIVTQKIIEKIIIKEQQKKQIYSQEIQFLSLKLRLIIVFIGTILSIIVFEERKTQGLKLMPIELEQSQSIMHFAVKYETLSVQVGLKNSEPIISTPLFQLQSTKQADLRLKIKLTIGYKVDRHQIQGQVNNQNHTVYISNLTVLDWKILKIEQNSLVDGYFNKWQLKDREGIQSFVEQNHLKQISQQAIQNLSEREKEQGKNRLTDFLEYSALNHESWLQFFLRRVNPYVGGNLEMYLPKVQLVKQDQYQEL